MEGESCRGVTWKQGEKTKFRDFHVQDRIPHVSDIKPPVIFLGSLPKRLPYSW